MRVVLTGADGFLGWHLRCRLRALTGHEIVPVGRAEWSALEQHIAGADAVVHLAGVNRGSDEEVEGGNVALARELGRAIRSVGSAPRLVFANSIQAGNATPYGAGKAAAGDLLAEEATLAGSHYVDVRLPNLFGEHGRPKYNSFVATFVRAVIDGEIPQIVDRPVDLLHVQLAAQALMDGLTTRATQLEPTGQHATVEGVYNQLVAMNELYELGDVPPLTSDWEIDLFNTLRAARFPSKCPIALEPRTDNRGRLVEVVRAHGGEGQTFVSTTKPGIKRGEHFHLRKVERFVVLTGEARISLRRLFDEEVMSFDVTGDEPVAIDMPTMWVHNITNTGSSELVTLFWTHELFDPAASDTYPEPVCSCVNNG